jgi:hypothetical protein
MNYGITLYKPEERSVGFKLKWPGFSNTYAFRFRFALLTGYLHISLMWMNRAGMKRNADMIESGTWPTKEEMTPCYSKGYSFRYRSQPVHD